jgi:phage terminase Nu1 subunit (DNA packaging protein)
MAAKFSPAQKLSSGELGAVLGLTERRVQQLEDDGILINVGSGRSKRFVLADAVQAMLLKSEMDARQPDEGSSRAKFEAERARKFELANDEKEGRLVPTEIAVAAVEHIVGMMRTDLAAVPARITEDVALRRRATDAIDTVLGGLAKRMAKAGDAVRSGIDPGDTD